MTFGERLSTVVAERRSQLVVGIDPDPNALWPAESAAASPSASRPVAELVAAAVRGHCEAVIDAIAPASLGVKFQLACFERLQGPGWQVLGELAELARARGLMVIADGKRGDIPVTSAAYAQALFGGLATAHGDVAGLGADLVTVNPLMGADAVAPFVDAARARGGGVLALVRTSNPGAGDVEDLRLADGSAVWERLAAMVHTLGSQAHHGEGLSDVGAVVGATEPSHLVRARELMPGAVFLVPGIGAQGGSVTDLAGALAPLGGDARRASVLVTAARSVVDAHRVNGGSPATAARAEAERLRALAWEL
ncbi:MAG: orotidine-5'-phosphate decarboxylase [Solirubrobacteraceae bacterium]